MVAGEGSASPKAKLCTSGFFAHPQITQQAAGGRGQTKPGSPSCGAMLGLGSSSKPSPFLSSGL